MTIEATTREEYLAGFDRLNKEPILATHTIGRVTVSANHRRWSVSDGSNQYKGVVTKGPATRQNIRTALNKWLELSGIR